MNTYLEERVYPFIEQKKNAYMHLVRTYKGMTLACIILILSALLFYCIGYYVRILYIPFILLAILLLFVSLFLFIFNIRFYSVEKQKRLKYLIQDIEEQINLYKYGGEQYATDKSDTLLLETIESIIKERS